MIENRQKNRQKRSKTCFKQIYETITEISTIFRGFRVVLGTLNRQKGTKKGDFFETCCPSGCPGTPRHRFFRRFWAHFGRPGGAPGAPGAPPGTYGEASGRLWNPPGSLSWMPGSSGTISARFSVDFSLFFDDLEAHQNADRHKYAQIPTDSHR